ncbi:hypothetical protein BDN72DRAFT_30657 [Pluteus cervinus]|uniref:Uncharacterized protein n=1 Tax=Pluteus cervinus TaxID=181527 RepID=A0ACD3BHL6_9AGAR|nr:hypothetical protein BDN72DRAFT_30657 [Pluteus cervinus]
MSHRILNLFTSFSHLSRQVTPPSNLTPILQSAAAQAWVRRISTTSVGHLGAPKISLSQQQQGKRQHDCRASPRTPSGDRPTSRIVRKKAPSVSPDLEKPSTSCNTSHSRDPPPSRGCPAANYIGPDIREDEGQACPGASFPYDPHSPSALSFSPSGYPWYWDELVKLGTPVIDVPLDLQPFEVIPHPTTAKRLYYNLLYIIRSRIPPPSLPALLDYHDMFPRLQSTNSYNLLISFAFRHAAFGTVQSLLSNMSSAGVPRNLETQKLEARYLVETGRWPRAIEHMPRSRTPFALVQNLPMPVLVEFFRTVRRGALGRHARSSAHIEPLAARDMSSRLAVLMQNLPVTVPEDMVDLPPRMIYMVILLMLRSSQARMALSLTESYFKALPVNLHRARLRSCLDIIHLHIALGSTKRGLERVFELRRMLVSLLALHPFFRPTSTTLFLLLSGLKKSKRCGTVAWSILRQFKKQWSDRVIDSRVRRRVASLALKEGRMDLVEQLAESEERWRRIRNLWNSERGVTHRKYWVPRQQRRLRPPSRTVFRKDGRERRLWVVLHKRIYQAQVKRNQAKGT